MPTNPDRSKPADQPGAGGGPGPDPDRGGGPEGGTILVALLIGSGLVLIVLKLLGVLG